MRRFAASLLRSPCCCGSAAVIYPVSSACRAFSQNTRRTLSAVGDGVSTPGGGYRSIAEEMRAKGFVNDTPHFSNDMFSSSGDAGAADGGGVPSDLATENAQNVDFVRDIYGPWLVMTEDMQGELFIDHDCFVFYRPANGLGYGIGRIEIIDAKASGTAFTLKVETYAYDQTTTFAPRTGVTVEVTGMVRKVSSASTKYETFSLMGIFRRDDPNMRVGGEEDEAPNQSSSTKGTSPLLDDLVTGQFNAAKLSPWTPTEKDAPWQPNGDLQTVFKEVFPTKLNLTSHRKRREEAMREAQADPKSSAATCSARGSKKSLNPNGPFHLNLDRYRVGSVPNIYYIPDYLNEDEERQVVSLVKDTPQELKSKITKRTVQEWGCTMCSECEKSFVSDANMPPWVQECSDMLMYDGIFTPATFLNSVRIHEYEQGEGIGPHCDGPIYVPCVTVLSLAATSVMNFYPRQDPYFDHPMDHYNDTFKFSEGEIGAKTPLLSVVLEPRSLLVFSDAAYYYYPHGVSDQDVDDLSPSVAGEVVNRHLLRDKDITAVKREYRVSLTTRNLLARCNHQPARAEYNMKRAWYVYNQLPVPEPLFTASPIPLVRDPQSATNKSKSNNQLFSEEDAFKGGSALSAGELSTWESKMDAIFKEQKEIRRSIEELKELVTMTVAADTQYRVETSNILNNLTTSVLDMDAKVEDIRDDVESLKKE